LHQRVTTFAEPPWPQRIQSSEGAGLPDGLFSIFKIPNLGKFWSALEWKMLVYFMTIWNILRPFGVFITVWYSLLSFGIFLPFWYVCTKKNLATLLCRFPELIVTRFAGCKIHEKMRIRKCSPNRMR
jgi:hypothetical protein